MRIAADVARRLSFRALSALQGGEVVLRYPDGRGRRFGDGQGPSVLVELRRPDRFWRKLGTRTRVAEILNRKRNLSIGMIRRLHEKLGISAEVLIRPSRRTAA